MKRTVEIFIEERVRRLAKRKALHEGRPLNDLVRDAIVAYLSGGAPNPRKREEAYQLFCEQPIHITRIQFQEIMEEDVWVV